MSFLRTRNICVAYRGRRVLHDVSLDFGEAKLVALVGPNGAGKTTLLKAMAGLVPAQGETLIGEASLASLDYRARAKRIAYLPQGHVVHWPLPVRNVVALGRFPHGGTDPSRLSAHDMQAVARAVEMTGLAPLADRTVTELSGGERGRVALARVLAVEAPIILADEPTASLDPRYQIEVLDILRGMARLGTLVLVVTHDLSLAARYADVVVVLDAGEVAAFGPPAEALSTAILSKVFKVAAYRAEHEERAVLLPWTRA